MRIRRSTRRRQTGAIALGWQIALALVVLLPLALVAAGRLGLLSGQPPDDLGVRDGRLKAPATTPNSVSSQASAWPGHPQAAAAQIDPLPAPDGAAALQRLQRLLRDSPGAEVVTATDDYLYVRFTTPLLRFVDDAEFWWDPAAGVVQVRSASRIGRSDLGTNRARIESLRAALAAGAR